MKVMTFSLQIIYRLHFDFDTPHSLNSFSLLWYLLSMLLCFWQFYYFSAIFLSGMVIIFYSNVLFLNKVTKNIYIILFLFCYFVIKVKEQHHRQFKLHRTYMSSVQRCSLIFILCAYYFCSVSQHLFYAQFDQFLNFSVSLVLCHSEFCTFLFF